MDQVIPGKKVTTDLCKYYPLKRREKEQKKGGGVLLLSVIRFIINFGTSGPDMNILFGGNDFVSER